MRYFILGTAGHIDHGKTSLVKALTGTDTDRLPEERRRGMTIELGFAELSFGGEGGDGDAGACGVHFGVVDVPGHERFVRTMVAGATGIDVALLVVAADDSVMPQTIEHFEILQLLGVTRAVVAVTKIDTVDSEMVELVEAEVSELLADTPLAEAPICRVSCTTGVGVEAVKQALVGAVRDIETSPKAGCFRMAIDRVFTVQGRGTVVTGSILRGSVASGDPLEIWPGGGTCRVRNMESHGANQGTLARGRRAAINISGVDRASRGLQPSRASARTEVRGSLRGAELATPGYLTPSQMIDVRLWCLSSSPRGLKSTRIVRLGISTVEVPVRVVLYEGDSLAPGKSGYAQLRCGRELTATYGQRFIIRDENATRTIGGGMVLRPIARRRRRGLSTELEILDRLEHGTAAERVEQVLRSSGFTAPSDLQMAGRAGVELDELSGIYEQLWAAQRWIPIGDTGVNVVPAALDDLNGRLVGWLERHHRDRPDGAGRHVDTVLGWLERMTSRPLARPLLDRLIERKTVKLLGGYVCLPQFAPTLTGADERLMAAMIGRIREGGFQPPSVTSLASELKADRKRLERLATLAVALGELVKVDSKLHLSAEFERRLRETVAELVNHKSGVTVSEVREALESSRKFVVPFLEYLDRVGFTKRIGDQRVLVGTERS